jgi:membrane-bound ClpP family serine protease
MTAIIVLILIGLFLFLVEFLLIPGITIAGIGGVGFLIAGIVIAYTQHGSTVGHITLISTIAVTIFVIAMALRSKTWKYFMLNTNVEGKVENSANSETIKPGDTGVTISRLSPMGKARINGIVVEAKSTGDYIDQKSEIEVIKIDGSKVIVKPKNNKT